jgi:two-component system, LytTR family, response regulator
MTRFRALVAEDEPLAREMVAALLRADPDIESVLECGDAATARDSIARLRPDIAFLDIELPGASGLQLADGLDPRGPVVVFITAFSSYATQAFDVSAVDYVLKPFSDRRFAEAVERAKRRVRERRLGELATQVASISAELQHDPALAAAPGASPAPPAYLDRLAFKDGDHSVLVKTADLVWIEAEDYYVLIHARHGRHLVRASLASLEQRLDPQRFRRVHRTAIVNLDEVRTLNDRGGLRLTLSDGSEVAVSRSRRSEIERLLRPRFR